MDSVVRYGELFRLIEPRESSSGSRSRGSIGVHSVLWTRVFTTSNGNVMSQPITPATPPATSTPIQDGPDISDCDVGDNEGPAGCSGKGVKALHTASYLNYTSIRHSPLGI